MIRTVLLPVVLLLLASVSCKNNPAGKKESTPDSTVVTRPSADRVVFNGDVGDEAFRGVTYPSSCVYYPKGIPGAEPAAPWIMISFTREDLNDPVKRQLTITAFNFTGQTGVLNAQTSEVMYSGVIAGDPFHYTGSVQTGMGESKIEITEYEVVSSTQALISGKISANLVLSSRDSNYAKNLDITKGEFKKVPVEIISGQ